VKHSGLKGAVHRELVHTGLIDAEAGRVFDRLFEARQRADYLDLVDVERAEAAAAIEAARGFVAVMRRLAQQR
jgi:uncharacterized protein (UPF0332 family)